MLFPQDNATGFTLIELVVAVSLSVLLLLTASTLFMTFLISSIKVNSTELVKSEGQYAQSQIQFLLRNAIELLPNSTGQQCTQNMSEIKFKSIDGGITSLFAEENNGVTKIASNSGTYLTSGSVELVNDSIEFDCSNGGEQSKPYVTATFTLRKGTPGIDQPRDIVEQEFSTSTTIRSL